MNLSQARIRVHKNDSLKKIERASEGSGPVRRKASNDLVICGDCLREMDKLPDGKFQLIFADPPYNNGTKYDADPTGDRMKDRDYHSWCKHWMSECARLLSPNGSLFIVIDDEHDDFFGLILRTLKDPPLYRRKKIVWWEEFGQGQKGNFGNAARYLHYFTRGAKGFVWNPERILEPSKRETVYHDSRRAPEGRVPANVWAIARQTGNKHDTIPFADHPPQIPDALLRRCILAASNEGDTVFDPFTGNGTTGRVALALGRKFLGFERSPKYAEQARQWINAGEFNRQDAKSAKTGGEK
jgi:DNA modification methylase